MITQREQYQSTDKFLRPYLDLLWKHAVSCGLGSKWLAERLGYGQLAEEAFMAGLLHDIGNLLLLKALEQVNTSGNHDLNLSKPVLFEVLDNMHTAQGSMLLRRWNLPDIYCEVVARHHDEDFNANDTILATVRLVDLACHKLGIGLHEDPAIVLAATREGEALGISELLAAELEIMLEDSVAWNSGLGPS
jgi:HD-like signal output (HDOD) protein